jgi:hypothetical protein
MPTPAPGETLIPIELPGGSTTTDVAAPTSNTPISAAIINGLVAGGETTPITIAAPGPVKVILFLDTVTPVNVPSTVILSNGTSSYTIQVSNTTSAKRIEFNNIPAAFVASFTILNNLGVSFPANNNSISISRM